MLEYFHGYRQICNCYCPLTFIIGNWSVGVRGTREKMKKCEQLFLRVSSHLSCMHEGGNLVASYTYKENQTNLFSQLLCYFWIFYGIRESLVQQFSDGKIQAKRLKTTHPMPRFCWHRLSKSETVDWWLGERDSMENVHFMAFDECRWSSDRTAARLHHESIYYSMHSTDIEPEP